MDNDFTRLYLLRHGETENYRGVFKYNGHNDVDVTREGERQLAAQAERLKDFPLRAVYSSDLLRARSRSSALTILSTIGSREGEKISLMFKKGQWRR
jgi:broad specificity phosphatase PhoE